MEMFNEINFITLIILALSTWRLSSLIVNEDGIFDIFLRLRLVIGVRYLMIDDEIAEYKKVAEYQKKFTNFDINEYDKFSNNTLGKLVSCVWCTSVWVAALYTVVFYLCGYNELLKQLFEYYNLLMALSTTAILIEGFNQN
jgi:hypothetical protein